MVAIRALKSRIRSVQNTRQITRAMEMVSATKLRRFQARAEGIEPYAREIRRLMGRLAADPSVKAAHPLFAAGSSPRAGFLVITSDRGLCGSYNTNVLGAFGRALEAAKDSGYRIYLFGRKGADWLRRRGL